MPRLAPPDPPLPAIATMAQALAAGLTPDQVRQRVRSGRWQRLARGAYRTRPVDAGDEWATLRRRHADRAIAEVLAHPGSLLGFASAAIVRDLPLWRRPAERVDLVARPGGHNGPRPGVLVHRVELHELDIVTEPLPMTSVARTWLDVTRSTGLADGLVLGDSALRSGAMTATDVQQVLATSWNRRGVRAAAVAAEHLDGERETPLESASWAYFLIHDLPLPRVQVEIRSNSGVFIARVDFVWEERRLVGEADGRLKYVDITDVYAEKRREDELRSLGFGVVRWGAADLRGPELAARLRRVLT